MSSMQLSYFTSWPRLRLSAVATSAGAYNQADQHGNTAASSIPCTNPAPVAQLYNAPVPPGVDSLSSADNSLKARTIRSTCWR